MATSGIATVPPSYFSLLRKTLLYQTPAEKFAECVAAID
jgi:hypothetical protein